MLSTQSFTRISQYLRTTHEPEESKIPGISYSNSNLSFDHVGFIEILSSVRETSNGQKDLSTNMVVSMERKIQEILTEMLDKIKVALILPEVSIVGNKVRFLKISPTLRKLRNHCEKYFLGINEITYQEELTFHLIKVVDLIYNDPEIRSKLSTYLTNLGFAEEVVLRRITKVIKVINIKTESNAVTEILKERHLYHVLQHNLEIQEQIEAIKDKLNAKKSEEKDENLTLISKLEKKKQDIEFSQFSLLKRIQDIFEQSKLKTNEFCKNQKAILEVLAERNEALKRAYLNKLSENRQFEKKLREKRIRYVTQLVGWVRKYDSDMLELAIQTENLKDLLDEKTQEFEEYEKIFELEEEEYFRIFPDEDERIRQNKIELFQINRAVRIIQQLWRTFLRKKKEQEKMLKQLKGKGKGKGKNKEKTRRAAKDSIKKTKVKKIVEKVDKIEEKLKKDDHEKDIKDVTEPSKTLSPSHKEEIEKVHGNVQKIKHSKKKISKEVVIRKSIYNENEDEPKEITQSKTKIKQDNEEVDRKEEDIEQNQEVKEEIKENNEVAPKEDEIQSKEEIKGENEIDGLNKEDGQPSNKDIKEGNGVDSRQEEIQLKEEIKEDNEVDIKKDIVEQNEVSDPKEDSIKDNDIGSKKEDEVQSEKEEIKQENEVRLKKDSIQSKEDIKEENEVDHHPNEEIKEDNNGVGPKQEELQPKEEIKEENQDASKGENEEGPKKEITNDDTNENKDELE